MLRCFHVFSPSIGFDVIAFCADVGQGEDKFDEIKDKAVNCGALKCVVEDLREEFVVDCRLWPSMLPSPRRSFRATLGAVLALVV